MVDNFAESANIQALFHITELTGVEPKPQRQEIGRTYGDEIIQDQKKPGVPEQGEHPARHAAGRLRLRPGFLAAP